MIQDRMKVLATVYIDRYNELISGPDDVRDKWIAVSTCQMNWDLQAKDFGKMFKAAMKDAEFLIDHDEVCPTEGITLLCKEGHAEEVREAFADLLMNDGGDIQDRQRRIVRFVDRINDLLLDTAPEKWHLRQKIRTAVKYLSFIKPQENYIFKASAAAAFAGYCDEEDEIGYDKKLNLVNYYRMCDELRDYLTTREDLQKFVRKGLIARGKEIGRPDLNTIDTNMHILVYDLIASAYKFDFYAAKKANRKSKISTVQQRAIDRAKKRARLLDQREDVVDEFEEIASLEKRAHIPELIGSKVNHRSFGGGKVAAQDGRYLTVEFDNVSKKFALPGALVNGFLEINGGEQVVDACNAMNEVQEKRKGIESRLTSIDVQLQMLE